MDYVPNECFTFLAMLFCHVLDDYVLQGILKDLKQRSWWESNAPDPKYANDYLMALACHAMSWSFMTLLPMAWHYGFQVPPAFCAMFLVNALVHAIVDDQKANKRSINLVQDQCLHFAQISTAFLILTVGQA